MTFYKKFQTLNIDLAPLGVERGGNECSDYCTPVGADIFGCAGVDGIHYCFVNGCGETVFAVDPTAFSGENVHPIAQSYEDFIRLLLACGSAAVLDQTYAWEQAEFDEYLSEYPPDDEQIAALEEIKDRTGIAPMEAPFEYIKNLQASFDYSKLKYKKEYYELMPAEADEALPPWEVYFNGNFIWHNGHDRAGSEIPVDKRFDWGDEVWYIPSVYSCGQGLVVDICVDVAPERIKTYYDKYSDFDEVNYSDEDWERIDAENPMNIEMTPKIVINGRTSTRWHGCSTHWIPQVCLSDGEENDVEARQVVEHYKLDKSKGWSIHRVAFRWATKSRPKIKSVRLTLECQPTTIHGIYFTVRNPGESVLFTHPITGTEHTLTVNKYEQQEFSSDSSGDKNMEFPTNCTIMNYTISPPLSDNEFSIRDCVNSDPPKRKVILSQGDNTVAVGAIDGDCVGCSEGIIGGADGPTAMFVTSDTLPENHSACSAVHFEPNNDVEWRIQFHHKMKDDITVEVI